MSVVGSSVSSYAVVTTWNGSSFDWTQAYTADSDVLAVRIAGHTSNPTVTYGGQAMTLRAERGDGNSGECKIYDLVSPPSGENDLVIDTGGSSRPYRVLVSTADSVDLAAPRSAAVTDGGFKNTLSSVVTTENGALVLDVICIDDGLLATVGAGQTATSSAEASHTNYISYSSEEAATAASTSMSWALDGSNWASQAAIAYLPAATGPTVSTPSSGTDGTNVQFTGTDCDTITTATLESGTVVKALNITAQTTTTINLDLVSGANGLSLGTPVSGIPLNPTITAAGITPYTVNLRVSDGVDSNTLGFTLNAPATHDVIQTMAAVANTNPAESVFGHVGGPENDQQALVPKTVGTTNFTWAADGTFTADSNDTETFDVPLRSTSTENWSLLRVTVSNGVIVSLSIKSSIRSSIKRSIVQ